MRLRFALIAVLALGMWGSAAAADDFDDDFGVSPAPKPAQPAQPEAQEPSPPFDAEPGGAPTAGANAAVATQVEAARTAGTAPPPAADDEYRDEVGVPVQNTLEGPVGGIHAVDAGSGPRRTFRTALYGRYFRQHGFLVSGADAKRSGAQLSLSVTPIDHLELSASVSALSTRSDAASPALVQSLGDARLFAKGYLSPLPWLTVGGDAGVALLNGVGGIGYQGDATSVLLRANATFDLRKLRAAIPLIARTNVSYFFDNSSKLVAKVESERYASLTDAAPKRDEYRHLVSATERHQLQINRVDMLAMGVGFELPMTAAKRFAISPIVEWTLGVPMNRQGYDCLVSGAPNDKDRCLAREGFSARPSTLTLGVRGEPGVRGLGLLVAFDVATSGRTAVRELAPNTPWELLFGLSFAYDTRPPRPVQSVREVAVPAVIVADRSKKRGYLLGEIVDRATTQPVPQAIVRIEGSDRSALACDEQGKLVSYELDPGTYMLTVSAPDYRDATCSVVLAEGAATGAVHCELDALPRLGSLRGRISGPTGEPVPDATLELRGPTTLSLRTDASGALEARELVQGHYEARVEASGYLMKATSFDIARRQESNVLLSLVPVPKQRQTELRDTNIALLRQVQFVANSAAIRPQSDALLAEVADILIRNAELKIEIQGHTDDTGTAARNMELSQARAEAVRDWLVRAGVDSNRLVPMGYGRTRPLAPNITQANRARNRRVEFVIVGSASAR